MLCQTCLCLPHFQDMSCSWLHSLVLFLALLLLVMHLTAHDGSEPSRSILLLMISAAKNSCCTGYVFLFQDELWLRGTTSQGIVRLPCPGTIPTRNTWLIYIPFDELEQFQVDFQLTEQALKQYRGAVFPGGVKFFFSQRKQEHARVLDTQEIHSKAQHFFLFGDFGKK